jgi:hypothetical protein
MGIPLSVDNLGKVDNMTTYGSLRGRRLVALLTVAGLAAIGAAGCSSDKASKGKSLSLVAYSVP